MGSAVSCEACPGPATGTVMNLSNALVLRIAYGIEERVKRGAVQESLEDKDWIQRLKCIDDSHSAAYGLSFSAVVGGIAKVENLIDKDLLHDHCPKEMLRSCLKLNKGCTLKCMKEVNDFINCIDQVRYSKLEISMNKRVEKQKEERRIKARQRRKK